MLVEREDVLAAVLAGVEAGVPVVVTGPVGCGKSAVLEAVRDRVRVVDDVPDAAAFHALDGREFVAAVRMWDDSPVRTVVLGPLSMEGTATLVRDRFPDADEDFVNECYRVTGGNPLFLHSVLLEVARTTTPVAEARPAAVRDRLVAWLSGQPASVVRGVRTMAVSGTDPGVKAALHAAGFLTGDALLPLVRDVITEAMTVQERSALQIQAAESLHRTGSPAEEVATRLMAITIPLPTWAVEVLRTAAHRDPTSATRYLRRALVDHSIDNQTKAHLLVDLATAVRGTDPQAALRHIRRAVQLFDDPHDQAEALCRLGLPQLESLHDLLHTVTTTGDLALRLEARAWYSAACGIEVARAAASRLTELSLTDLSAGKRELLAVLLHLTASAGLLTAVETRRMARLVLEHSPPSPDHVYSTLQLLAVLLVAVEDTDGLRVWLDRAARRADPVERELISVTRAVVDGTVPDPDDVIVDHAYPALAWIALETRDAGLRRRLLEREPTTRSGRVMLEVLQAVETPSRTALARVLDCGAQWERVGRCNAVMFPWRLWAVSLCGDTGQALALAEEQLVLARRWGADKAVAQAAETVARLREPVPEPEEQAVELTLYELRVVELAVLGISNIDIAERLGLSRRTVEKHLTNSYRKLGIKGRTDLATAVTP